MRLKKHNDEISEPITVIKKDSSYFIIDKFEFYEAALLLKQKTIRIFISDSNYDPLVAHIRTTTAIINPIRKIRAIRSMLVGTNTNELLAKSLRLDSYYSQLLGVNFTSGIEKKLEDMFDYAISIGIQNIKPQIKFFESVANSENSLKIIKNNYTIFRGCNKSNFFWSVTIAEALEPKPKKIGKDLPRDRDFKCSGCGTHYLIRDGNTAEMMLENEKFLQIMSAEGDVSTPINYIPETLSKYIGSPNTPASFKFSSLDDAVKKFKGKKFKIIILANRDDVN